VFRSLKNNGIDADMPAILQNCFLPEVIHLLSLRPIPGHRQDQPFLNLSLTPAEIVLTTANYPKDKERSRFDH